MYKADISSNYRLLFRYSVDLNTILLKKINKAYRNRTPNGRSKLVAAPQQIMLRNNFYMPTSRPKNNFSIVTAKITLIVLLGSICFAGTS